MAENNSPDRVIARAVGTLSHFYNNTWDTLKNANEYIKLNPEFSSEVFDSLDRSVSFYNEINVNTLTDEQKEMCPNIFALKNELPQIKSINEIITYIKNNRNSNSETFKKFIQTTNTMFDLMNNGKEFIKNNPTNSTEKNLEEDSKINDMLIFQEFKEYPKEATAISEIIHAYEIFSSQPGINTKNGLEHKKKDWMTDIILETCALDQTNPLFQKFKEMGWYDGYDHLSPKLRQSIGAK